MERQKVKEVPEETVVVPDKKIEELRKELETLKLKKELKIKEEKEKLKEKEKSSTAIDLGDIEKRLENIEEFLESKIQKPEIKIKTKDLDVIEKELQSLEKEIVVEPIVLEKEITAYDNLIKEHPWLEETRYEYMYAAPDKKRTVKDYQSWLDEWSQIFYDYARISVLHILYLRKLNAEKPFSKLRNRDGAIAEIAQKLVDQNIGKWLNKKKKEAVRIYWKTLDEWAEEIIEWAQKNSKLEPILTFEIRESGELFADLPKRDLTRIFKKLENEGRGEIIKTEDGEITFKIKLDY
jgi:hypothetical protein